MPSKNANRVTPPTPMSQTKERSFADFGSRNDTVQIFSVGARRSWSSGRILACHAGGPGSIPGLRIVFLPHAEPTIFFSLIWDDRAILLVWLLLFVCHHFATVTIIPHHALSPHLQKLR
ncbi:conserved hypothetical protein, unlikely [Trypanosoma brucei gambiense DAL972]|uniref:Uncharacterized protein n=1 Tax=Trypanosoma brucei gambiense (strain MHOM/CI/86/DAL972) TaxID=679716 RepID=C9ZZ96_TRYB9|nr:conserved hypothetical protein, unlikely [Trypanosoma brucei gambiense DAL972]CBH14745.1 conserved hypothetical protein, unlikely [Trypanosoma brucei gambiense DAL972]|eukprot:XP_011777011.1 conserved hypothetical protein, unlikely [Trypanosoma brucei gambiense DAL972]